MKGSTRGIRSFWWVSVQFLIITPINGKIDEYISISSTEETSCDKCWRMEGRISNMVWIPQRWIIIANKSNAFEWMSFVSNENGCIRIW